MRYLFLLTIAALVCDRSYGFKKPPHILPDAPSYEYMRLSKKQINLAFSSEPEIEEAIKFGERNLRLLISVNSTRPDDQKIQLTKPGSLSGVPIEAPGSYSPKSVNEKTKELKSKVPSDLAEIIFSNKPIPNTLPISDEEYIKWAKQIDRNYQTATRWKMLSPYIPYLSERRVNDLRGYYYLGRKNQPNQTEALLREIDSLEPDTRKQIIEWMNQICFNNEGSGADCQRIISKSIKDKKLYETYLKYLPGSEKIWNGFFSMYNPRVDIKWTSQEPKKMFVPFLNPGNFDIVNFLKNNIEDEFKWLDWNLIINFTSDAAINVQFVPGATPHVNGLGGETIVMDANTPITEWDVQWTIRHEFGHVLGFTDCYVEFYEKENNQIVNYQLDTTHLMCSRAGKMNENIYQMIKSNYFKN